MRDSAIFTSLLLASATLTSASRIECLRTRSQELAVAASCGHEGSLNYCFSTLALSTEPEALSPEVERCFVNAGCTPAEARIEASRVLEQCGRPSADLRRARRHDDSAPLAARNPFPAGAITAAMYLPRQTDGAALVGRQDATTTEINDLPSSPSPCFTDTTVETTTCPIQTTGPESGKQLSCFPTAMATPKCRDGLICKSDARGNPSCMYKHSKLELDGIIIAIVFASAIALSVVSICFLCCRERREHRRIERAAEAARIAKEAKTQATVAAKRPGAAVTGGVSAAAAVEGQPLMYQGAGGPPSPSAQQQQFPQQQHAAGNPFTDAGHDGHPLR
ncbi:hypothetical protein P885DRAFT_57129 [Corynascus similis CBS 632.67]